MDGDVHQLPHNYQNFERRALLVKEAVCSSCLDPSPRPPRGRWEQVQEQGVGGLVHFGRVQRPPNCRTSGPDLLSWLLPRSQGKLGFLTTFIVMAENCLGLPVAAHSRACPNHVNHWAPCLTTEDSCVRVRETDFGNQDT